MRRRCLAVPWPERAHFIPSIRITDPKWKPDVPSVARRSSEGMRQCGTILPMEDDWGTGIERDLCLTARGPISDALRKPLLNRSPGAVGPASRPGRAALC